MPILHRGTTIPAARLTGCDSRSQVCGEQSESHGWQGRSTDRSEESGWRIVLLTIRVFERGDDFLAANSSRSPLTLTLSPDHRSGGARRGEGTRVGHFLVLIRGDSSDSWFHFFSWIAGLPR